MWSVDIDFQDDRREEVIAYVKRKYGEDCVSNIITFGNMKSKSAVKDMARVLDYPPQMGDKISKLIPDKVKNLTDALNSSVELKDLYDADKDVRKIVDGAIEIEGLPKSTGKHACGVLISPRPVTEFIPQVIVMDKKEEKNDKGEVEYEEVMVTQVDMTECEELGLLKMDFLGLKTLTIIAKALELANKKRVSQGLSEITTKDIPLNDPYAYQHIKEGNTLGVFQLESPGMTDLVSKTYSDISNFIEKFEENQSFTEKGVGIFSKEFSALFERLIALISLYRPGPMDEIPNYLHQMNNPQDIEYDTEESKEILKETFGIIVYQEQVMHMVREMAGFSKGQSDVIRKAMGKFCPSY